MPIKVLVVEDEPDLEFLISRKFRHRIRSGELAFIFAGNGVEALKQLEVNPDIAVAMSDIKMPEMDGLTLLQELSTRYPYLQTIIVSAFGDMKNIRTAMNRGAYDFLTKPIDFSDLELTLDKTIRHVQQLNYEIQERKNAERQMLQLKKAVETMQLGVTISDLEGVILYTNPADARIHGYAVDELIGKHVSIFAPPELRRPVTLEKVKQWKGLVRESTNVRKDGSIFPVWLMSEIVRDPKGEPTAIVTSCEDISDRKQAEEELRKHRDHLGELVEARTRELIVINEELQKEITERKRAESALRESEFNYRSLFENLQDIFYRTDMDGNLLLVSPSIVQFLGYLDEEAIGLNLGKNLFADPQQWNEFMRQMEQQGFIEGFEVQLKRENGMLEWGSANAQFYTDREGHILGVEGVIRDITARKEAEAKLLTAHNELKDINEQLQMLNASKDKFFSIISHDLRSPFNVILGFSQLIDENVDHYSKEEIKTKIQKLRGSAEQLYALLENLLTWSRIQRGAMEHHPEQIDLREITAEGIDLFASKADSKQLILKNSVPQDTSVYADANMLHTVLRNLISNAMKFTHPGGTIEISTQPHAEPFIEVVVADTGTGISKKDLAKLFRIDVQYTNVGTAGETGTGLGLNLCKELVKKNGGTIGVESEIGKGATFRFTLPKSHFD